MGGDGDMTDFQREVLQRLTRIETKMELRCVAHGDNIASQDKRITGLETAKTYQRGLITAVAALGGIGGASLTKILALFAN